MFEFEKVLECTNLKSFQTVMLLRNNQKAFYICGKSGRYG